MENTAPELERLYFALAARIDLPRAQKRALISDFRRAAEVLVSRGLSPAEAAARLGHERLGDFYLSAPDYWYPLDDAAKLYPMSMTDGWMSVFRLSAYLDAPVEPSLLQLALDLTMPRFPFFATRIKRGVFWHYIDGVKRRFTVQPETELPCAPMNVAAGDSQSFRVLYYGRRVSVEFFHILTDGTGGLAFLTALLWEYLRLSGEAPERPGPVETDPCGEECENAFTRWAAQGQETGGRFHGASGGAAAGPARARPPGAHPAFRAGRAGPAPCREGARRHRDGAAAGLHDRGRPCRLRREPGRYQHPGGGEHAQILPLEDSAELFNVLLRAHALGGGGEG